jgi:hypothetical protein
MPDRHSCPTDQAHDVPNGKQRKYGTSYTQSSPL